MTGWQLTIDANDPGLLARFWVQALGYEMQPPPDGFATWREWYLSVGVPEEELEGPEEDLVDRLRDPAGGGPDIWFQPVPEGKEGKNRLHLDLFPTGRDRSLPLERRIELVEAEVARLVAAGATIGHRTREEGEGWAHYGVQMHDPEGNEFCIA